MTPTLTVHQAEQVAIGTAKETPCPIKPLSDCVVIEVETDRVTPGGLKLPDKTNDYYLKGKVLAVGPGRFPDNYAVDASSYHGTSWGSGFPAFSVARFPMTVKPGDTVAFVKAVGAEIEHNGKKYHVVHEGDILAVIS